MEQAIATSAQDQYFIDVLDLPADALMKRLNPEWYAANGGNGPLVDQALDRLYPDVTLTYLMKIGEPWRTKLLDRITGYGEFPGDPDRRIPLQLSTDFKKKVKEVKDRTGREPKILLDGEPPKRGRGARAVEIDFKKPVWLSFETAWRLFYTYSEFAEDPDNRGLLIEVLDDSGLNPIQE